MNITEQPENSNPDALLNAIKYQESISGKGRMKIFLGMSAGVGKTYAMLKSAQALKEQGVDVVVGTINTHGRKETADLLIGLKTIPEKIIKYKGILFKEFDVDAILKLKPQLVLVDELAHTNVPGSRQTKRWQDIMEILDNGIDVFTTLNVQHIESLKDIVENITGIKIRETVPDSIIEAATSIEVIDFTPEEILKRLKEGKVYLGDTPELAIKHFFQEDHLTALREIVLRYAAEKVDHDLQKMLTTSDRANLWKPRERLLVGIDHDLYSQKAIRTTRRIASNLHAPWIALYVDDGKILDESESDILAKNLSLARNLGAEVITTHDPNIADGIKRIARQRGVSQIILGRPQQTKSFFNFFYKTSIVDKLEKECTDIDIHLVKQENLLKKSAKGLVSLSFEQPLYPYLYVLIFVLSLTGISWFLYSVVDYRAIGFFFLIGILLLSLFFKKGPIFLASILSAIIWTLLIPPLGDFTITEYDDIGLVILFVLTAMITGILVDRAREQKEMLAKREDSIQGLYNIVRQISNSTSPKESFRLINDSLIRLFHGSFELIVKNINDGLQFEKQSLLVNDSKEKSTAVWVFDNGQEAGWSTDTLPSAQNLFLPLKGSREIVGVLVYKPEKKKLLTIEQKNFIYTICQQLAAHIERLFTEERGKQHEQLQLIEKVYENILIKISQEIKFPIFDIQNAVNGIKNKYMLEVIRIGLTEINTIEISIEKLIEIVNSMSVIVQFSENLIPVNKSMQNIRAIIEDSYKNLKKLTMGHRININFVNELPLIYIDPYLIRILLTNLITNAIKSSALESLIEIETKKSGDFLVLSVLDEGEKIPENQLDIIFEKFYGLQDLTSTRISIGLTAATAIAKLHHGHLKAENRPEKGTSFSLFLPIVHIE